MTDTVRAATSFDPAPPHLDVADVPLSVPQFTGREWAYVKECLDTTLVSSVGPFVARFERTVADYLGARFAVATASGTAALHIALLVAGVRPDDEVLVPALTFIAPANAVRYAGAWPVFMDVDPDYWQLDPAKVRDFLRNDCRWQHGALVHRATSRRVRAILPVHLLGHPADMTPILELARDHGLVVIEDAAESLGTTYGGQRVGRLGDVGCLSFNGNKVVTAGGGGMLITDNPDWAARAKHLTTQAKADALEYIHDEVGFNYRLSNLQAAVGLAQMERLDEFLTAKRAIATRYRDRLGELGLQTMKEAPWAWSTFWLYTVLIRECRPGKTSRDLLQHLHRSHILARPLWQPLHRCPAHAGSPAYRVEVADRLYREAVSLPSSVGLTQEEQERVVGAIAAWVRSE